MKGLLITLIICLIGTWIYDSFVNDVSAGAVYIGLGALIVGSAIGTFTKHFSDKTKQG